MIPLADITAWRETAPWRSNVQVEQDLLISRALVAIYSDPFLAEHLAFRGGTALHKLRLPPAARYSEDIDLVQVSAGPIGAVLDRFRVVLEPFLGRPRKKQAYRNTTLRYTVESEGLPVVPIRLKVELNCREHVAVLGMRHEPFAVESRWFTGACNITTFALDELLATKLRALYQRRKGRDLFDLWHACNVSTPDAAEIARLFGIYMANDGASVPVAVYRQNLAAKITDDGFRHDTDGLLRPEIEYDIETAHRFVDETVLSHFPVPGPS